MQEPTSATNGAKQADKNSSPPSGLKQFVESARFTNFILLVIVINSIIVGMQTSKRLGKKFVPGGRTVVGPGDVLEIMISGEVGPCSQEIRKLAQAKRTEEPTPQ